MTTRRQYKQWSGCVRTLSPITLMMKVGSGLKKRFPQYFYESKVLEVGSLDINGSIRQFFVGCDYVGVDLGEGRGVDVVARGEELDYPDDSFDVVASCECFEHNPEWVKTFNNIEYNIGVFIGSILL